jgi:hypothetical protein
MKPMTEPQRVAVERLLSKGWIEPLRYRLCVYLFLPENRGREGVVRDWSRRPIRVTPEGAILASRAGDDADAPPDSA